MRNSLEVPTHASVSYIGGEIFVPPGALDVSGFTPNIIVPDEVARLTAQRYGIGLEGRVALDPMGGAGTIPRVIAGLGGVCHMVELDSDLCAVARSVLPPHVSVANGDCLTYEPSVSVDDIFTSVPFSFFQEGLPPPGLAKKFRELVRPGGTLTLDSDDITERHINGKRVTWPLAARQIEYFEQYGGFKFEETHKFIACRPGDSQDTTFTEIRFTLPPK